MKNLRIRLIQLEVLARYIFFLIIVKIFRINNENVWLISERGNDACDNGYAFFQYLKKFHKEIEVKYVISKKSNDLKKFENLDDVIYYQSNKHFIYFLTAGYLISSHIMGYSPEFRLMQKLDKKNLIFIKGKKIFLQHGITKDKISSLFQESTKLDLFICGAKPEYEYIKKEFGYKDEVQYTGFARYDHLENKLKKQILLMPTWRKELYHCTLEEFSKTNYFKAYQSIINNPELIKILEKFDFQLIFYPHYEIQKFITSFTTVTNRIIIANSKEYSVPDLLRETQLLITDYSSVFFDFAYLKKPIIYYQFDYEDYRSSHYEEGYFSYERNGFGEVCTEEDALIKNMIEYFKTDFKMKEKYQNRLRDFFVYHDHQNCDRIYNEIIKLKEKK